MDDAWRMPWLRCETGAPWLDLLATQSGAYGPTPRERLTDVDTLAWWLDAEDLRPSTPPTEQDLASARTLRDALRAVALAVLRDQQIPRDQAASHHHRLAAGLSRTQIPPDHVAELNRHLAADRPLTWPPSTPATTAEALGRVARAAVETLTGDRRADLHQCADTECGLLFLDASGRRRWCAAEVCGVRNRVRSHRERTRAHQQ